LRDIVDEAIEIDVLVVGSEGAGARACIAAHDAGANVLCVTKGFVGKTGATLTADADVDVELDVHLPAADVRGGQGIHLRSNGISFPKHTSRSGSFPSGYP